MRKSHYSRFRLRLLSLGVTTRLAGQIERCVSSWIANNGIQWTVDRLKLLKQSYIRRLGGLSPLPGIKYHRNGVPAGTFGALWALKPRLVLDVLNCYTMYTEKEPTKKQLDKFYGSVMRPPVEPLLIEQLSRELLQYCNSLGSWKTRYIAGYNSQEWYTDTFTSDHEVVSVLRSNNIESWISSAKRAPASLSDEYKTRPENKIPYWLYEAQMEDWTTTRIDKVFPTLSTLVDYRTDNPYDYDQYGPYAQVRYAGCISYIQEPGLKLRAIANPKRGLQALLAPLGFGCYNILRGIDEDHTHNHDRGVEIVQHQLKKGKKVYSFDLSDATNNLPRDLQFSVLLGIGASAEDVEAFRQVCDAWWMTREGYSVRWTVGQPLGVFPSFASFALLHHALLRLLFIKTANYQVQSAVERKLRKEFPKYQAYINRPWAIIGDDVCIWDDELAQSYQQTMEALGVPISKEKSITSSTVAEFAKRVITRDAIMLPHKWSPVGDEAVKSYLTKVGRLGLLSLTPRQRRIVDPFLQIPEPYGMGWNSKGLSARVRSGNLFPYVIKSYIPVTGNNTNSLIDSLAPVRVIDLNTGRYFRRLESVEAKDKPCLPFFDQKKDAIDVLHTMSLCGLPVAYNLSQIIFDLTLTVKGRVYFPKPGMREALYKAIKLLTQIEKSASLQRETDRKSVV